METQAPTVWVSLYIGDEHQATTTLDDPGVKYVAHLQKWIWADFKPILTLAGCPTISCLKVFKGKPEMVDGRVGKMDLDVLWATHELAGHTRLVIEAQTYKPPVPEFMQLQITSTPPPTVWVSLYIGDEHLETTELDDPSVKHVNGLKNWILEKFKSTLTLAGCPDISCLKVFKGKPEKDDNRVGKMDLDALGVMHELAGHTRLVIEARSLHVPRAVKGVIERARTLQRKWKDSFGVRHSLYRLAAQYGARHPVSNSGVWYDETDLHFCLWFADELAAKRFQSACSMPNLLYIQSQIINDSCDNFYSLKLVMETDYEEAEVGDDSSPEQRGELPVSESSSSKSLRPEVAEFQLIGDGQQGGKIQSAHIVDQAYCKQHGFNYLLKDPNNILAADPILHQALDGDKNTKLSKGSVKVVILPPDTITAQPEGNERQSVTIRVKAIDKEWEAHLPKYKPKHGTLETDQNGYNLTVSVVNAQLFVDCLNWKLNYLLHNDVNLESVGVSGPKSLVTELPKFR